ncbi:MAG: ABC transporter ATP-binding protein [Clostridiaceae bacterium]|nr:ABC transporter ATP-binding protein [Clostridiaceae bacterium]
MKQSLVSFLRPYYRVTSIGLFMKLMEAALELTLPIFLSRIIDYGILPKNVSYVIRNGLWMLLIVVIALGFAVICQYCAAVAAQGFGERLRTALFRHINRLSDSEQRKVGTESLMNRVSADVERLQLGVSMLVRLGSRIPFVTVGAILASVSVDAPLSAVILIGSIAFIIVSAVIILTVFPLYAEMQGRLDRIGRVVRESFLGARVIRAFRKREARSERLDHAVGEHERSAVRAAKVSSFMQPSTQFIMNCAICAVLWFGSYRINSGELTSGQIVALINYILQILVALMLVANLAVIFTRAAASAGRVREVFALLPEPGTIDKMNWKRADGESEMICNPDAFALEFENVTFRYTNEHGELSKRASLMNLSFGVRRGETMAVTGTTGSGKSTLIRLLFRTEEVTDGHIRVNGSDIRSLPLSELRSVLSVVHQAPRLFSGTIAENLRWGNEGADEESLKEACRVAQAWDFVAELPEGLNARVERNGRNFSGGQRQRLAIARALVKESEVLILDDCASALDYITEAKLYRALEKDKRKTGRTLVIVSQRIAAIRFAQNILVLDDGQVAGFGPHERLIRDCAEYKAIAESQHFGRGAV